MPPKKIYAPAETIYVHIYEPHIWNSFMFFRRQINYFWIRRKKERRVRTIQRVCHFTKAVIRLSWAPGQITRLKKETQNRSASNKAISALDESASADEVSGRYGARKCVKVSDGEQRWILSYFRNEWVKRHKIQTQQTPSLYDRGQNMKEIKWDSTSLLNTWKVSWTVFVACLLSVSFKCIKIDLLLS